ncbi:MAG: glycine dehydrogenase (aminomethyl-transferring), partial [Mycobacteriaceae bacterium]
MATPHDAFPNRHIGPDAADTAAILTSLGYGSTAELAAAALPQSIAQDAPIGLAPALDETEALAALRGFADRNTLKKQLIGAGYYDTVTPAVIRRNVVENPGWYTAYTPYQPEISQGRLEALLNFQTMVEDLTGLPIAGASLLDEATAVAEAVQMMARLNTKVAKKGGVVLLDENLHPSSINITRARAAAVDIPVEIVEITAAGIGAREDEVIGVVVSNPGTTGALRGDLGEVIETVHARDGLVTVAADLLAQVLLTSPGELGAD